VGVDDGVVVGGVVVGGVVVGGVVVGGVEGGGVADTWADAGPSPAAFRAVTSK
jgi:hypothetical protein